MISIMEAEKWPMIPKISHHLPKNSSSICLNTRLTTFLGFLFVSIKTYVLPVTIFNTCSLVKLLQITLLWQYKKIKRTHNMANGVLTSEKHTL